MGWALDQVACYPMCDSKVVANTLTLIATCWSAMQKISFVGAKKLFENGNFTKNKCLLFQL